MEDLVNLCPQDEARVQAIHKEIDIFDCLATSYLDREYLKILKETGENEYVKLNKDIKLTSDLEEAVSSAESQHHFK